MTRKKLSPLDSEVSIYRNMIQIEVLTLRETLHHETYINKAENKILKDQLTKLSSRVDDFRSLGQQIYKTGAPAYTPSGTFGEKRIGQPIKPTNQVQLDFDHQMVDIKKLFNKYKFITAAAISFSGKSFYLLVNTDGKDYEGSFYSLVEFFKKEKLSVDLSVSSVNELRYIGKQSECHLREYPDVYKKKSLKPKTHFDKYTTTGNGELIPIPKELIGQIHYHDFISWIGINNSNGVPVEKLIANVSQHHFDKSSHLYKDTSKIKYHIERVYEHYQEQHGKKPEELGTIIGPGGSGLTPFEYGDLEKKYLIVSDGKEADNAQICAVKATRYCIEKYRLVVDSQTKQVYRRFNNHLVEISGHSMAVKFIAQIAYEILGLSFIKSGIPSFTDSVRKCLLVEASQEIKTPRNAFNLRNGVIEFFPEQKSFDFREHSEADMFTYILDYDYDPTATCDRFNKFINRVIPDAKAQETLFEYVATMFFTGEPQIDKILFLIGGGANGKSTLLDVFTDLFGDAVQEFSLQRVTDPNHSPSEMFNLKGKILGICHEAHRITNHEMFNQFSTRRPMTMWQMRVDRFTSNDYPRSIVAMNHLINIANTDAGERRFLGISMDIRIPEEEQDPNLRSKLKQERSGILNYILQGYKSIVTRDGKFTDNDNSRTIKEVVIRDNDRVQEFLDYYGIKIVDKGKHTHRMSYSFLYNYWQTFCESNDIEFYYRRNKFGEQIKRKCGYSGVKYGVDSIYFIQYDITKDQSMAFDIAIKNHESDIEARYKQHKERYKK